ncbi:MAG TPA: cation-translocating P-type ATPase [Mucilaginibacter sp.]|nr:cation-translocating P-type ATPase [Mucilaginibacter sp.]
MSPSAQPSSANHFGVKGLDDEQVLASRRQYGNNRLVYKKSNSFIDAVKSLIQEPMVILLLIAAGIYFIGGNTGDAVFMAIAVVVVAAISLYQDKKSRKALEKLRDLTQPDCKVIRNGEVRDIRTDDLVLGDSMMIDEGTLIAADGIVGHSNDFSVNESVLTGESMAVYKDQNSTDNRVYRGTTVASGLAIVTVTEIGNSTRLGQIGKSLEEIQEEKTPMELQISNFVKKMVFAGAVVFLVVWVMNYIRSYSLPDSLLKSLTLAMSILPEEIPVAFTTFMALGAWRLMQMGVVVKQMKTVETLGSATVICTDKTGTLTENRMSLARIYAWSSDRISNPQDDLDADEKELVRIAMWASEPIPFDPMEIALHEAYLRLFPDDERSLYAMAHEYPLDGKPPMMTHIFENSKGKRIIAAKGAPEALMNVSGLNPNEKSGINDVIGQMSAQGYRVLGVAEGDFKGYDFPQKQQDFRFRFKGIVAFYDPPKENIRTVLQDFYRAGIKVKIISGDNAATTVAIAKEIGFKGYDKCISGDELIELEGQALEDKIADTNIFARMFPEAKVKVVNMLKAQNEIVAMTGDGVNDGPALKAAHIGIAMGQKGTEIAKQAASLILAGDDLSRMVDAVALGRKIYANLKKAIRYIISIHIPIILTVFIPLALGWIYPNIFSPVHVIFLELIMGPTCSIVYENEPIEKNMMSQKPRPFTTTFFNWKELTTSIIQGLVITVGALATYRYGVYRGLDEQHTRTMVFTSLVVANVFLTLINRSFYYSFVTTLKYRNNMMPAIILLTLSILALLLFVKVLNIFFSFATLNTSELLFSSIVGFLSVIWYEAVKWFRRTSGYNNRKKEYEQFPVQ